MNKNRENKPKTKLVVRNLPQQLAEEQFRATVEKFLDDTDYFVWDKSFKKLETRCFLNFKTPDAARNFVQKFNGHIFITPKGKEQRAIVEYVLFQKTPKKSKRADPRENTIEADADYLKFLEELKKPTTPLPSAEEQLDKRLAETQGTEPVIVTPLMEFIRNKRAMKAQKSQQRAQGRKKKEENKGQTPNKQADEKVENKRKDRSSRRKEREEKRKEKKKEKEGKPQVEKQPTEKPAPSKPQEKQNEPKAEKPEKQPSKKETAEEKKNRNGMWQVRQHIEPGTVAIQQREKAPTPLNKDATVFQPGSMAHLQQFHQPSQPLSYQAQPFVPQFQTVVPAYYQTMIPQYPPQMIPQVPQTAPHQAVPQTQPKQPSQQPSSPGNNQRKQQQGGRGGGKSGKSDKRPSQKVYAPKQAPPSGNAPQQSTGNTPGP